MVVVRDVIPDSDAKEVGEELRAYIKARGGHRESCSLRASNPKQPQICVIIAVMTMIVN